MANPPIVDRPSAPDDLDSLCNEFLTGVELLESQALSWGFVEARVNPLQDLDAILAGLSDSAKEQWRALSQGGLTLGAVLDNLRQRSLLFESNDIYRTRFAETVRLLYLLRQRFSREDWQTGKRLVSDLRIQLQRRRYPKRDVPFAELESTLRAVGAAPSEIQAAGQLLRGSDGAPFSVARFQQKATQSILKALHDGMDKAIAIGAGTGAGKTKAFYVPALSWIASHLSQQRHVQALALYPKTELLKDQLAEAFSEARKLDDFLMQQGKRPITLAAYYGDTPTSAESLLAGWFPAWTPSRELDGWICPFFACPNPTCDRHDLVWTRNDVEREKKANAQERYGQFVRLRCSKCQKVVTSDHLLFTRESMKAAPPDILFTTTEMLNRCLARPSEHALIGVDMTPAPRLLLLDEMHSYEGLTGAQTAYLLRRWRHARRKEYNEGLCLVGLSATLTSAESFLAKLSGMQPYHVEYITPAPEDLISEGLEYNLVLKGDPVSGASLLSTSTQTLMLLGRMLDPSDPPLARVFHAADTDLGSQLALAPTLSGGVYGHRIFAFTDNLDIDNRWYHIEVDAEKNKTLSQYRQRDMTISPDDQIRRIAAGQDWTICERIGHPLDKALVIDRVSSQNRGIRQDADVVIATSALEVGFNDPTVGAVVQHKAPLTMASFLQRKGRAGRTRIMRPWTVVVTTAYGRDRWIFQHAEQLFDPVLPPLALPIENSYVRKIQATYAFMDWLALELSRRNNRVDVWNALSGATHGGQPNSWHELDYPRRIIAQLVADILSGVRLDTFSRYLESALGLEGEDGERVLQHVLWSEPRSLLFDVLPTVLRQVETSWQKVVKDNVEPWSDHVTALPLSDFVPPTLFSDLNVPELQVHLPAQHTPTDQRRSDPTSVLAVRRKQTPVATSQPQQSETQSMTLLQGMSEFAPGRVSKRFATSEYLKQAHWLPLPPQSGIPRRGSAKVEDLEHTENADVGDTLSLDDLPIEFDDAPRYIPFQSEQGQIAVYRPRSYSPVQPPAHIQDTSNAWLRWRSHFLPTQERTVGANATDDNAPAPPISAESESGSALGSRLSLALGGAVRGLVRSAIAYTQATGTWVDVTRLAVGVRAETSVNGRRMQRALTFTRGGAPAALGYTIAVDALAFDLASFDPVALRDSPDWAELYRRLGPQYYRSRIHADPRFAACSSFHCDWLWQVSLSMLVTAAAARGCSLPEALEDIKQHRREYADRTMRVIFQTEDSDDAEETGRLRKQIEGFITDPQIAAALDQHIRVVWSPVDPDLDGWLRDCYASSAGAALFAAVTRLAPDIDPDELFMDVEGDRVWISEASAGGVGIVSRLADALAQRPRDLEMELRDTLRNCAREEIGGQLHALAEWLADRDPTLMGAFTTLREKSALQDVLQARAGLAKALEAHGLLATRELLVAIISKFLRPNSDTDSDQLIASLVKLWDATEARLGTVVDLRIMAVAALRMPEIASQLEKVLTRVNRADAQADEAQKFNLLQSLLWLSCVDSCPDCLEHRQTFQDLLRPSRPLLLALLRLDEHPITYSDKLWDQRVREQLASEFQATVACDQAALQECKRDMLNLLTQPVEINFQLLYPLIERIERRRSQWLITLSISEMNEI